MRARVVGVCFGAMVASMVGMAVVGVNNLVHHPADHPIWSDADANFAHPRAQYVGTVVSVGGVLLEAGLFGALYLWMLRGASEDKRGGLTFGTTNLSTVGAVLRGSPGLTQALVGVVLLAELWFAVFLLALGAGYACNVYVDVALVLGFLWGASTLNVATAVAVADAVGTWCVDPTAHHTVRAAFGRAFTTRLATAAWAGPTVDLLEMLQCVVGPDALRGCLSRNNHFGFCGVGLHGLDFHEASTRALALLTTKGWADALGDQMVNVLPGRLFCGLSTAKVAIVGPLIVAGRDFHLLGLFLFGGFLVGFAVVGSVLTSAVTAAVGTAFMVYAEAEDALRCTQPAIFARVYAAMSDSFPELFDADIESEPSTLEWEERSTSFFARGSEPGGKSKYSEDSRATRSTTV